MSTRLANWAMSQLYLADGLTAERDGGRLSAMPHLYLYGLFTASYPGRADWSGAAAAANCVLRAVTKKYAERRLDVLGRGACSLPSYRFPYPFPVHNQNWSPYYGEGNVPLVDVSLPGDRVTLRLRGGPEMGRQLAGFREIVAGAKRGELSLHRRGRREMVKLVAHFPARAREAGVNTMVLTTRPDCLWEAHVEGPDGRKTYPRRWQQDHVRSWVLRHDAWLRGVSEDTKREKRVPRRQRRHIDHAREDRCRKYRDRLETYCHEASKQLADFALRQGVSSVIYDDGVKEYLPHFPWHSLKEKLAYKLGERGISLLSHSETYPCSNPKEKGASHGSGSS